MILWIAALFIVCVGVQSAIQQHKQPDFPLEVGNEDLPDIHEPSFLDSKPGLYAPYLSPGFFPSIPSSNVAPDDKIFDPEDPDFMDVQKRISRLVIDPHSKRWSEIFRVSPQVYRELRNSGQRVRPIFSKDFVEGRYKARKRPYYYTEPEGSEFLGGPGK